MDTYSLLREFADSWALLAMVLFFVGVMVWAFRPGSRGTHRYIAETPMRNDDVPLEERQAQIEKEARS